MLKTIVIGEIMSAEQELLRAKKLIQAKRYEDAKALLITIDHPTADKWLAKVRRTE
jgi:hypothetical protein